MINTINHKPVWWSWQTILEEAYRLGIPNFQRGAVWEMSNRVALLESVLDASPCGSFVFWQPESTDADDPLKHGILLSGSNQEKHPLWIVDGQQRIRAMLDIYNQLLSPHIQADSHLSPFVRKEDIAELLKFSNIDSNVLEAQEEDGDEYGHVTKDSADADNSGGEVEGPSTCPPLWLVVFPAMKVFAQQQEINEAKEKESEKEEDKALFQQFDTSKLIHRSSMFRQFRPRVQSKPKDDHGKKQSPVPPIPQGTVPLASLLSSKGVFNDPALRSAAVEALRNHDVAVLNDLLPWGPQFLTGYAYGPWAGDNTPPTPLKWKEVLQEPIAANRKDLINDLIRLFSEDRWQPVLRRFPAMLSGARFAAGRLPKCDVSTAIDVYVRINRSGIRVLPEEQALALLSRARPELLDDLSEFILKRDGSNGISDQRELLSHTSHRQMGFTVWMAMITRYSALSLFGTNARNWLWTKAIDKKVFRDSFDKIKSGQSGSNLWADKFTSPNCPVESAKDRVKPALLLIDDIFSKELHLDHRMARTKFLSLQPLIDLFFRVSVEDIRKLREDKDFRDVFARVMLWTMLCSKGKKDDMEKTVHTIHDINNDGVRSRPEPLQVWPSGIDGVRSALRRYVKHLPTIDALKNVTSMSGSAEDDLNALALAAFQKDVGEAQSLQHAAVGWLYAIERRNNAREFSWQAQFEGYESKTLNKCSGILKTSKNQDFKAEKLGEDKNRLKDNKKNKKLERALYPERQHIVPFVRAKAIVGKTKANSIGNLTWLSHRQNCLTGLSYRWMVLDAEKEGSNLDARGFHAPATVNGKKTNVLDVYESLRDLLPCHQEQFNKEYVKELYNALYDGRQKWMVEQMKDWLAEDLSHGAMSFLIGD